MYCKWCGKPINNAGAYCPFCGGDLSTEQRVQAPKYIDPSAVYNSPYPIRDSARMFDDGRKRGSSGGFKALVSAAAALLAVFVVLCLFFGSNDPEPSDSVTAPSAGSQQPQSPGSPGIASGEDSSAAGFREPYTVLKGDGSDTVTIMIYMVGSDLESDGASATADIAEMMKSRLSENVNVVVETGGCTNWYDQRISDGLVERWLVGNRELIKLEDRGRARMLTVGELSSFIEFCAENYPADRYGLIFWDHGGGSVYGFGYDELYPSDTLFLPDISNALKRAGTKFDFVGFDACLMASVEVAYMLEPYADWLIASQETEPSTGWEYTTWLNALSENTSLATTEIANTIIKRYAETSEETDTLSCVSLREVPYVYECLCSFLDESREMLENGGFNRISSCRAQACSFSYGEYDMVDIVDLAYEMRTDASYALIGAVSRAVKCRNNSAAKGANGLSMYYPYTDLDSYSMAKSFLRYIGLDYGFEFFDRFLDIMTSGKTDEPSTLFSLEGTGGGSELSELETLDDGNGGYVIPIAPELWDEIVSVELSLVIDDGGGYVDLGSDAVFYTDDNDNLTLDFDGTWVAIGGCVVPSYAQSTVVTDDSTIFVSSVDAVLNGEQEIALELRWLDSVDNGYIAGYRTDDGDGQGTLGKLLQLKQGDTLRFCCDRYYYDGSFAGESDFGREITVGSRMPEVTYEMVECDRMLVCYKISDVYQNVFYTDMVEVR